MINKKDEKIHNILIIALVVIHLFSFVFVWLNFSPRGSLYYLSFITYQLLLLLYSISFIFFSVIFDAYAFDRRKVSENVYSLSLSCFISCFLFYFLDTLAFRKFTLPLYLFIFVFISIGENYLFCNYAKNFVLKKSELKKTIIYYHHPSDITNITSLQFFNEKYSIIKKIKDPKLSNINLRCDTVFVANIRPDVENRIIEQCLKLGIEAYVFPNINDVIVCGGKYVEEMRLPMVTFNRDVSNIFYVLFKRFLDIFLSFIAIVILSPVLIFVSILIKIYDGGPVLYTQERLTKDNKVFVIYKFRSMKVDAEKDGVARVASRNDNRITPIGRFIRSVRIDELPQLFNIIRGDMSIVGPRPERPEIASKYEKKYPSFNLRLQVKAGLTGYAQVYGKYNTNPLDKLKMDLYYINRRSILFDIKLCLMTIKILFMKECTEGFDGEKAK